MREFIVNDKGEKTRVILGIAEYERLREVEGEMEDIRRYDAAIEAIEGGEDEVIPLEQAIREIRGNKAPGGFAGPVGGTPPACRSLSRTLLYRQ